MLRILQEERGEAWKMNLERHEIEKLRNYVLTFPTQYLRVNRNKHRNYSSNEVRKYYHSLFVNMFRNG